MPSTIWSGAIAFGLVTIPIKVSAAAESHSVSFHQYHLEDMGRVRTRKVCEVDGRELANDEISRGYEISRDQIVEVTDADLADMPLPTAKAIEIVAFVPAESIDPIRISDSYYLAADGAVATKPYVLLRRALERSRKVAIAQFAWHGRQRLGLLSLKDSALVLHAMKWPDEVRDPAELAPRKVDVDEAEIERAMQLMDSMAADDVSGYRDEYRAALEKTIEAKAHGQKPPQPAEEPEGGGQIMDLMAALEQSVESARDSRGEGAGEGATVHDMPKKKAPAKTAKKTAAKKTAGRKPRSA